MPLEIAYLARRMNEHFGNGTASYVEVRDAMIAEEHQAWLAFFSEWDKRAADRKADEEHDKMLKAATRAMRAGD